jgi:hypothetical protein
MYRTCGDTSITHAVELPCDVWLLEKRLETCKIAHCDADSMTQIRPFRKHRRVACSCSEVGGLGSACPGIDVIAFRLYVSVPPIFRSNTEKNRCR